MHSCETTLIGLTEKWKLAIDSKKHVGILSTDMSKAFDSLHPSLLINKLKAYGFSDHAVRLMRSYLTRRQNRAKLNSAVSDWLEVRRGCPQGSSFGSLLWNIFQNDMTDLIQEASLSMYADDHQLYVTADSIAQVEQSLNIEGEIISRWYRENFLQGNYNKYSAMIVSAKKVNNPIINVNIDVESIESKPSLSLLGVTLDDRLSYSAHISDVCKKAGEKVGVLTRLRNLVPKNALLQLYKLDAP